MGRSSTTGSPSASGGRIGTPTIGVGRLSTCSVGPRPLGASTTPISGTVGMSRGLRAKGPRSRCRRDRAPTAVENASGDHRGDRQDKRGRDDLERHPRRACTGCGELCLSITERHEHDRTHDEAQTGEDSGGAGARDVPGRVADARGQGDHRDADQQPHDPGGRVPAPPRERLQRRGQPAQLRKQAREHGLVQHPGLLLEDHDHGDVVAPGRADREIEGFVVHRPPAVQHRGALGAGLHPSALGGGQLYPENGLGVVQERGGLACFVGSAQGIGGHRAGQLEHSDELTRVVVMGEDQLHRSPGRLRPVLGPALRGCRAAARPPARRREGDRGQRWKRKSMRRRRPHTATPAHSPHAAAPGRQPLVSR